MRLPYLQIAMEVLEQLAPEVAIELDHNEDAILGKLIRLIQWGLGRCPDHLPPSHSSLVHGEHAAKHIARGALWLGDPQPFIDAICRSAFSILEIRPDGIRIKGLDRYDAAWEAQQSRSDKARAAANKRWGNARAMLEHQKDDASEMPQDAKTQIQIQTHITTKRLSSPSAPELVEEKASSAEPEKPEDAARKADIDRVIAHYVEAMKAQELDVRDTPKRQAVTAKAERRPRSRGAARRHKRPHLLGLPPDQRLHGPGVRHPRRQADRHDEGEASRGRCGMSYRKPMEEGRPAELAPNCVCETCGKPMRFRSQAVFENRQLCWGCFNREMEERLKPKLQVVP